MRCGGTLPGYWLASISRLHFDQAAEFYAQVLGLKLQLESMENNWAELGPDEPSSKIAIYVPAKDDPRQPGGPSGVVLETDSIFEFHRKLVDEEVVFKIKPEKRPWGGADGGFLSTPMATRSRWWRIHSITPARPAPKPRSERVGLRDGPGDAK